MRHVVSWQQTTTFAVVVEISLPDLAKWAITNAPLGSLASPDVDRLAALTTSLELNQHLRARLLQLYAQDITDQEDNEKTKTRTTRGHRPTHPQSHTWTEQGESS
jgi:L-ribulose-5-phosphate 3-epimerase UlaE